MTWKEPAKIAPTVLDSNHVRHLNLPHHDTWLLDDRSSAECIINSRQRSSFCTSPTLRYLYTV